jgi:H+/Cl- antiporter ClcA
MGQHLNAIKQKLYALAEKNMQLALLGHLLKWTVLGGIVGILTGTASALFLASLDLATNTRMNYPWILFLLPLGGAMVSFLYFKYGKEAAKGNNLILEQIHGGNGTVPFRMAPLVFFGTLITHLFGGSAGREGTAVQMGGSLSEWVGNLLKLDKNDRKIILMCGISSGFGSVFGTPLSGAIFGMEVLAIGMIQYEALIPCFVASFVGNVITTAWGIQHIHFSIGTVPQLTGMLVLKITAASIIFGLVSFFFSELTHFCKNVFAKCFKNPMVKSFIGGCIIIGLTYLVGTRDYLGLGIPLISQSFEQSVPQLAFLWKTLFTSLTLGAGFQGGEVTPLFVIGATLGNSLSDILQVSAPLLAAIGFVAVFCGATNTPIACFLLGVELFGSEGMIYLFMGCVISYLFSGHSGIYVAQKIGISKTRIVAVHDETTLESIRKKLR